MNEGKATVRSAVDEILDEQFWKLVELKKFCLSEAADLYDEPEKIVKNAQGYMDFLMGKKETAEYRKFNFTAHRIIDEQDYMEKLEKRRAGWDNADRMIYAIREDWFDDKTLADIEEYKCLAGWDNAKVKAFNEWNGKPPTNNEQHENSKRERVLDLERIAKNKFLCWSIWVYATKEYIDRYTIKADINYENVLEISCRSNACEHKLVYVFLDSSVYIENNTFSDKQIDRLLEPYWIDREDVT